MTQFAVAFARSNEHRAEVGVPGRRNAGYGSGRDLSPTKRPPAWSSRRTLRAAEVILRTTDCTETVPIHAESLADGIRGATLRRMLDGSLPKPVPMVPKCPTVPAFGGSPSASIEAATQMSMWHSTLPV